MNKLEEIQFPEKGFKNGEEAEARTFLNNLVMDLGVVGVSNTLRTVYMSRQKQNLLMKAARVALRKTGG